MGTFCRSNVCLVCFCAMGLWRARARSNAEPSDAETNRGVKRAEPEPPLASGPSESVLRRQKPRRSRSNLRRYSPELHEVVGPATESREEHLCRHPDRHRDCPRCRFYILGVPGLGRTARSTPATAQTERNGSQSGPLVGVGRGAWVARSARRRSTGRAQLVLRPVAVARLLRLVLRRLVAFGERELALPGLGSQFVART